MNGTSPLHLLLEDSYGAAGLAQPIGTLWCPNAGVTHKLAFDGPWRSPETDAVRPRLEAAWTSIAGAIDPVFEICRSLASENTEFAHADAVIPAQTISLFRSVLTKAVVLDHWLAELQGQRRAVGGRTGLSPVRGLGSTFGLTDSLYGELADRAGCDVERCGVTAPPATFDELVLGPERLDRLFNVLNRTASATAFQLWQRVGSPTLGAGKDRVLIMTFNDMIEEGFLRLLSGGYRVGVVHAPRLDDLGTSSVPPRFAQELGELWHRMSGALQSERLRAAAWSIVLERLLVVAGRLPEANARVREWADRTTELQASPRNRPLILANGLYAPASRLIDAVLRQRGVPVVCADHGIGFGLGARHDLNVRLATGFADHYVTHNAATARGYAAARSGGANSVSVGGSPAILSRARLRGLQRAVYRRRLGVGRNERVLMYVTSISANNLHQGAGTSTDTDYQDFQRALIEQIRRFPGRVIVKPYPVHRYADPEPVWNLEQNGQFRLAPPGEFRQQRWAADMLLLDLCSSTLGWAIGAGVPLIYVDNVSNPLAGRARAPMSSALFLIDALKDGWQSELTTLLMAERKQIEERWLNKKVARETFDIEFGLGPKVGAGPAITNAVAQTYLLAGKRGEESGAEAHLRRPYLGAAESKR